LTISIIDYCTALSATETVPDELFEPFVADESVSPDTVPGTSVPGTTSAECSEYGLSYFAGWLAFKFRRELPHLGDRTGNIDTSELEQCWHI
jgi:hypothetical protein